MIYISRLSLVALTIISFSSWGQELKRGELDGKSLLCKEDIKFTNAYFPSYLRLNFGYGIVDNSPATDLNQVYLRRTALEYTGDIADKDDLNNPFNYLPKIDKGSLIKPLFYRTNIKFIYISDDEDQFPTKLFGGGWIDREDLEASLFGRRFTCELNTNTVFLRKEDKAIETQLEKLKRIIKEQKDKNKI